MAYPSRLLGSLLPPAENRPPDRHAREPESGGFWSPCLNKKHGTRATRRLGGAPSPGRTAIARGLKLARGDAQALRHDTEAARRRRRPCTGVTRPRSHRTRQMATSWQAGRRARWSTPSILAWPLAARRRAPDRRSSCRATTSTSACGAAAASSRRTAWLRAFMLRRRGTFRRRAQLYFCVAAFGRRLCLLCSGAPTTPTTPDLHSSRTPHWRLHTPRPSAPKRLAGSPAIASRVRSVPTHTHRRRARRMCSGRARRSPTHTSTARGTRAMAARGALPPARPPPHAHLTMGSAGGV